MTKSITIKRPTAIDPVLEVSGNTYEIKAELRKLGFRWNSANKCWFIESRGSDIDESQVIISNIAGMIENFEDMQIRYDSPDPCNNNRVIQKPASRTAVEGHYALKNANNAFTVGRTIDSKRINTNAVNLAGDEWEAVNEAELVTDIRTIENKLIFIAKKYNYKNRQFYRDQLHAKWDRCNRYWWTTTDKISKPEAEQILLEYELLAEGYIAVRDEDEECVPDSDSSSDEQSSNSNISDYSRSNQSASASSSNYSSEGSNGESVDDNSATDIIQIAIRRTAQTN